MQRKALIRRVACQLEVLLEQPRLPRNLLNGFLDHSFLHQPLGPDMDDRVVHVAVPLDALRGRALGLPTFVKRLAGPHIAHVFFRGAPGLLQSGDADGRRDAADST